jgi:hypothetical protein
LFSLAAVDAVAGSDGVDTGVEGFTEEDEAGICSSAAAAE